MAARAADGEPALRGGGGGVRRERLCVRCECGIFQFSTCLLGSLLSSLPNDACCWLPSSLCSALSCARLSFFLAFSPVLINCPPSTHPVYPPPPAYQPLPTPYPPPYPGGYSDPPQGTTDTVFHCSSERFDPREGRWEAAPAMAGRKMSPAVRVGGEGEREEEKSRGWFCFFLLASPLPRFAAVAACVFTAPKSCRHPIPQHDPCPWGLSVRPSADIRRLWSTTGASTCWAASRRPARCASARCSTSAPAAGTPRRRCSSAAPAVRSARAPPKPSLPHCQSSPPRCKD